MVVIICKAVNIVELLQDSERREGAAAVWKNRSTLGLVVLVTSTLLILARNFYWDVLKATVAIKKG